MLYAEEIFSSNITIFERNDNMKSKLANLINQMEVEYTGIVNRDGWSHGYKAALNGEVYDFYKKVSASHGIDKKLKLMILKSILNDAKLYLSGYFEEWIKEFGGEYPNVKEIAKDCRKSYDIIRKSLTDKEIYELQDYVQLIYRLREFDFIEG